jgi:hypothetical protein
MFLCLRLCHLYIRAVAVGVRPLSPSPRPEVQSARGWAYSHREEIPVALVEQKKAIKSGSHMLCKIY